MDDLKQAIRRIAIDINDRMSRLQNSVSSNRSDTEILTLRNLSNCVRSAASVVSSASTTLGEDDADRFSITHGSEFGDCFPSEPGESMLRWISSNTVYEFEAEPVAKTSSTRHKGTLKQVQSVEESTSPEQSDSDNDLEVEMVQALFRRGKEKLQAKDHQAAEQLFRNCLTRISSNTSMVSSKSMSKTKSEIMSLLLDVYLADEKWDEAQLLLLEKITVGSRDRPEDDGRVLKDMLTLVDIFVHKRSYTEALLYGRRALRGYRKMGAGGTQGVESSLKALVRVSHLNGNYDEEEAYSAILLDSLQLNVSKLDLANSTSPDKQSPGPHSLVRKSPARPQKMSHIAVKQSVNLLDDKLTPSPTPKPLVGVHEIGHRPAEGQFNLLNVDLPQGASQVGANQKPNIPRDGMQLVEDASSSSMEIAAIVNKGHSTAETGDKSSQDSPTVLQNSVAASRRGGHETKWKKLVLVGDSTCGKTALLM